MHDPHRHQSQQQISTPTSNQTPKIHTMNIARVRTNGQITLPKTTLDAAHIREGDILSFEIDSDRLIIRRITPLINTELSSLQDTLFDWHSKEDEAAWRDL